MKRQGLLIVVSGPSGAGKGTVCKGLMERRKDIKFSISATTRAPRQGEEHGVQYFFVNREEFERMLAEDELLEWASVYDNYYGTPKQPVKQAIEAGQDTILEIDIQGAMKVKQKFPDAVYVFIMPPSMEVLKDRITKRGTDAPEVITKRLNSAVGEMEYVDKYDYVIINDQLEESIDTLHAIITAEKSRPWRGDYHIW